MPKPGEYTYFEQIGEEGRRHAVNKPFSDEDTARTFMDLAALFSLLPAPPARILECGCGTGWLCYFLARKGYDVVGQDCSRDAIELAKANPLFTHAGKVEFICSDFEELDIENEFDAVVFYASLHHSQREEQAIRNAFRALRPGGVFLAIEPGVGHEAKSQQVIEKYDVGDRDMPPTLVVRIGKQAGFRERRIYLQPAQLTSVLYSQTPHSPKLQKLFRLPLARTMALLAGLLFLKRFNGLVWMRK
jgi:SAM-dependent methyltransferase